MNNFTMPLADSQANRGAAGSKDGEGVQSERHAPAFFLQTRRKSLTSLRSGFCERAASYSWLTPAIARPSETPQKGAAHCHTSGGSRRTCQLP